MVFWTLYMLWSFGILFFFLEFFCYICSYCFWWHFEWNYFFNFIFRFFQWQYPKIHGYFLVNLTFCNLISFLSCLIIPVVVFKKLLYTWSREGNGTHSSILAWKIPWTEEPGRLQSIGSRKVRHDWATSLSLFTFMHWRRKWQPTPVFLSGESQGWCRTESDTTEVT